MDRSLQSHWEAGVGATRHLYGAHFHPARDNLLLLELEGAEEEAPLARSRLTEMAVRPAAASGPALAGKNVATVESV